MVKAQHKEVDYRPNRTACACDTTTSTLVQQPNATTARSLTRNNAQRFIVPLPRLRGMPGWGAAMANGGFIIRGGDSP